MVETPIPLIPDLRGIFFMTSSVVFLSSYLIFISSLFVIDSLFSWNWHSNTWSLLCGLYDLIKIKFILGQSLHLLCLSEIGNPKLTLLVCDLTLVGIHELLYWWAWSCDLVYTFVGEWFDVSIDSIIMTLSLIHCSTLVPFLPHDKQTQMQYQSNCSQIFQSAMLVPYCLCC